MRSGGCARLKQQANHLLTYKQFNPKHYAVSAKPPLPGPRYQALLQLLRTAEALWNASRNFFARWDLSPSQFNVLNLLYDQPEGCTQIDLSRSLIMHRSNVTGLVDRLETRGLVRRHDSAHDRRAYPPPGRLVDVGGYKLHIFCMGEGSPTVNLDHVGAGNSAQWGLVQPEIAKMTRVCAYDRAGPDSGIELKLIQCLHRRQPGEAAATRAGRPPTSLLQLGHRRAHLPSP